MSHDERDQTLARPPQEFDFLISAPTPDEPPRSTFGLIARADTPAVDASAPRAPSTEAEGAAIAHMLRPRIRRRRRSFALDWVALALAFLAPPIGLVTGLIALMAGSRRNGWASPIATAATSIAVVLSLALAGVLVAASNLAKDEQAHAELVESSRDFCAALDASPGVLTTDAFGWPAPSSTVSDSLVTMVEFEQYWRDVEAVAPDGVRPEATLVAAAARSIISSVEASRIMDPAADLRLMRSVAGDSRIPAWVAQYCE